MQKVIVALLLGAAAALAPSARASPKLDRRAALQQSLGVVAGALALPQVASADGAVSTTTIQRSRGIYGGRIAALKDAVAKGDFAAVADEKNAFLLFNSGAYTQKNPQIKAAKAATVAAYDDVASAVAAKDAGKLKAAYAAYVKAADIDINPKPLDVMSGQGYSNDYDWKVPPPSGIEARRSFKSAVVEGGSRPRRGVPRGYSEGRRNAAKAVANGLRLAELGSTPAGQDEQGGDLPALGGARARGVKKT